MPKRAMSFKPTPECEVQLAELMDRWDCDRTAAVIRAVAVALDASSQVGMSKNVHIREGIEGPSAPHMVARDLGPPPDLKSGRVQRMKSVRPDPEKIAAAQKAFGMGGVKKK